VNFVKAFLATAILFALLTPGAALADSTQAQCAFKPTGATKIGNKVPCTFSQRQGYVDINIQGGKSYSLTPVGSGPGKYKDGDGNPVFRRSGLGSKGQIYKLSDGLLYVYW
jgi:hypothetical protein